MRRFGLVTTMTILCAASSPALADSTERSAPKHTVFIEYFGASFSLASLNYEHRVLPWLGVRGGVGFSASTGIGSGEFGNFVVSASAIKSFGDTHHVEVSPGIGGLRELDGDRTALVLSLLGGYRYQPRDGGFFGRVQLGLGHFNRSDKDARTFPSFGLALGWSL